MGRPVLSSYFVNMDCMDSLSICNKKLRELLDGVGWSNALNIAENAYPNLIKVFYSSMDASAEKQNWVITSVADIPIEFDVVVLNSILETKDEGLELYSTRKELKFKRYAHVNAVRNICRRSDLFDDVCNLQFPAQYLCLQVRILHSILQHVVTPRGGHAHHVTRLDVALLDCILRGRKVNFGYVILRHMLSIPAINNWSFAFGGFITRILTHFWLPIDEPTFDTSKKLGDELILSLGFDCKNGEWVKDSLIKNRYTLIAPSDRRMLNDVVPVDQLPDCRTFQRPQPPPSAPEEHAPAPNDDQVQLLLGEVRTLSEQQAQFQQHILDEQWRLVEEQQLISDHHQQLVKGQQAILDAQRQLFEALRFPFPHLPAP